MASSDNNPGEPVVDRDSLTRWVCGRLQAAGGSQVEVGELTAPSAGFSGQTVLFSVSWRDSDGRQQTRDLVMRLQPAKQQVYFAADALRQARTMAGLAAAGEVPVPSVWQTEPDAEIFGTPFYVMERVQGRIPVDVPSWHSKGWTVDLPEAGRTALYDNALLALTAVHRTPVRPHLEFLVAPGGGTALERNLAMMQRWYDWCEPGRRWGGAVLEEAMGRLVDDRPVDDSEVVVWGDARVGNMIFADDLSVAALLDWEAATTGPPGMDVGWWLMFENLLCEAKGKARLPGIEGRDGTIRRYVELSGLSIDAIDYYELRAVVEICLITCVIADNAVKAGKVTAEVGATYPRQIIAMMRAAIDRLG